MNSQALRISRCPLIVAGQLIPYFAFLKIPAIRLAGFYHSSSEGPDKNRRRWCLNPKKTVVNTVEMKVFSLALGLSLLAIVLAAMDRIPSKAEMTTPT
jgi:hypothetical protein